MEVSPRPSSGACAKLPRTHVGRKFVSGTTAKRAGTVSTLSTLQEAEDAENLPPLDNGITLVAPSVATPRFMKLSISLPAEEVGFLDAYARSHGIKSRSGAIQAALRLLRTSQLADDYASAWAEWSEEDDPWAQTSNDGMAR